MGHNCPFLAHLKFKGRLCMSDEFKEWLANHLISEAPDKAYNFSTFELKGKHYIVGVISEDVISGEELQAVLKERIKKCPNQ